MTTPARPSTSKQTPSQVRNTAAGNAAGKSGAKSAGKSARKSATRSADNSAEKSTATSAAKSVKAAKPARAAAYEVRQSPVHGKGVFALRPIAAGERIIEYRGERITWDQATRRAAERGGPINHTFYFSLADGNVIDGGRRGNDARWINHACEPNCEAYEDDGRVYIHALRDIDAGEELNYNYALIYDERHTPALKRLFACRCGTPACTGTMLAPKKRSRKAAGASA
jgi:SET domain-containing protein